MGTQRMNLQQVAGEAYEAMLGLERSVHRGNLSEALIALVKIRASQLNRCAFCLDMHTGEARRAGISQHKLDLLPVWREATELYDEREQAALELTEEVTLISREGVRDEVWGRAASAFAEADLASLVMAICAINSWNRMAVATRRPLPARAE